VLLESAHPDAVNYRSYLFLKPERILKPGPTLFDEIEAAQRSGFYVAGLLSYELGELLQGMTARDLREVSTPLVWLGVYRCAFVFNHRTGEFEDESPDCVDEVESESIENAEYCVSELVFDVDEASYREKIDAIHEYILDGETYQVNFTGRMKFAFSGSPCAMYSALLDAQAVPYAAFLNTAEWQVLSCSPEMFFRVEGDRIITRPMKGTAHRGSDPDEDKRIAQWLYADEKNRSENVMIVDLMRNDLGRICAYGSVQVDELFTVERYETLFQMTSQVSGRLRAGTSYAEIFASLFPSGSVTGAPKLRTMQIIRELETSPRGVYTGAIGFFSPKGDSTFSVPIRTVVLSGDRGEMGLGSGITIDSRAEDEYRECLLKSQFLTRREKPFCLIESILWNDGFRLLPLHLERLESSAKCLGFRFDRAAILTALDAVARELSPRASYKVRLLLDRAGSTTITSELIEKLSSTAPVRLIVSRARVCSADPLLRHKTTRRELYDREFRSAQAAGFGEVLFLNERDEVAEGAISNVFIEKQGAWFTPPASCGLLPGVFRRHLLETMPNASERVLLLSHLLEADAIYICNAVRGCRKAILEVPGDIRC
jgi:para-aminobenzoate synthetase/4-amino-4-deoxychorismate lyase